MIRILLDELGDGHGDIILKIDVMPVFTRIGDLYYMADFLCLDPDKIDKVPDDLGVEYIKYVKERLKGLTDSESFIIFNIQDECIEGLLVSKKNKGLVQVAYGTTTEIRGHEIDKDVLDPLIDRRTPAFKRQGNWLISLESMISEMDWSIERIKKNGS